MKIIRDKISKKELKEMAQNMFGNMVKAVVDTKREVMAVDGELHSDEEGLLLRDSSSQKNLWGINIYPDIAGEQMIEFDSMINLRPSQNNLTRGVDDLAVRQKIKEVVNKLVK